MDFKKPGNLGLPTRRCEKAATKRLISQIYTEYIQNNTGKLYNVKQGTYLHSRIKIYVQDSNDKDDGKGSFTFLEISCHTKFRIQRERHAVHFG